MNFSNFASAPIIKYSPAPGDVHVNQPLSNIVTAYLQNPAHFVASNVFANVPTSKQSDIYYKFDRSYFNRSEMGLRAPGAESRGANFSVNTSDPFYCAVSAVHVDIPEQVRENTDSVINLDRAIAEFLARQALIYKEKIWASKYFKSGVWGTDKDVNWSGNSDDPIVNIRAGRTTVLQNTGYEPNILVLGKKVYDVLADNPDIIARVDSGQTAGLPAMAGSNRILEAMKALFEVDEIYVMKAIQNTGVEGAAESSSFIGGDHALLAYKAPIPTIMMPSAGYTFNWTGFGGAGPAGSRIRKFYLDKENSDRYEIEMAFDCSLVASDLGYFFPNAIS